ncbi:hypothetical protein [Nostoc sp. FACHB-280]|uniref:hypothetical protein n=1 Tax=Nostoc sp. FACHB-280 TaxID=2692839 RepID=UPI00168B47FC|nr:hypothetical protein [Nostoc sp. FACHB-280]MBD2496690.1 hypothetical protein [Nostoc sp. FACHB-280]
MTTSSPRLAQSPDLPTKSLKGSPIIPEVDAWGIKAFGWTYEQISNCTGIKHLF